MIKLLSTAHNGHFRLKRKLVSLSAAPLSTVTLAIRSDFLNYV